MLRAEVDFFAPFFQNRQCKPSSPTIHWHFTAAHDLSTVFPPLEVRAGTPGQLPGGGWPHRALTELLLGFAALRAIAAIIHAVTLSKRFELREGKILLATDGMVSPMAGGGGNGENGSGSTSGAGIGTSGGTGREMTGSESSSDSLIAGAGTPPREVVLTVTDAAPSSTTTTSSSNGSSRSSGSGGSGGGVTRVDPPVVDSGMLTPGLNLAMATGIGIGTLDESLPLDDDASVSRPPHQDCVSTLSNASDPLPPTPSSIFFSGVPALGSGSSAFRPTASRLPAAAAAAAAAAAVGGGVGGVGSATLSIDEHEGDEGSSSGGEEAAVVLDVSMFQLEHLLARLEPFVDVTDGSIHFIPRRQGGAGEQEDDARGGGGDNSRIQQQLPPPPAPPMMMMGGPIVGAAATAGWG